MVGVGVAGDFVGGVASFVVVVVPFVVCVVGVERLWLALELSA